MASAFHTLDFTVLNLQKSVLLPTKDTTFKKFLKVVPFFQQRKNCEGILEQPVPVRPLHPVLDLPVGCGRRLACRCPNTSRLGQALAGG